MLVLYQFVIAYQYSRPSLRTITDAEYARSISDSAHIPTVSSVARGGRGGGGYSPPIGLPTKMQNKENTTFLALLRLSFALDQTKK